MPLFPIVHLFILIFAYQLLARSAPFGNDLKVFFATGLMPTLAFIYVSRFMSVALLENRPMLFFPNVRLLDVVLARAFLEFMGMMIAIITIFLVLIALGSRPYPHDPAEAVSALAAVLMLAVGMGILASVITMLLNVFAVVWALSMILVYIFSGFLFVPAYLPQVGVDILSWNPVLHGTEWMRVAFYPGYPDQILNKSYLLSWAIGSLFAGLAIERLFRGRALAS